MTELTYTRNGDYFIPNISLSENRHRKPLGKYGNLRKAYLYEHRPLLWNSMVLSETFFSHLAEIDETANLRLAQLLPELMEQNDVTEELKSTDPMRWVGLMNNLKSQADEIILTEVVYG